MKKALFTIGALIVLVIAANGIEKLYCDNAIFERQAQIEQTKTTESAQSIANPNLTDRKLGLNGKHSDAVNPQHDHKSNGYSHDKPLSFLSIPLSDWITAAGVLLALWASLRSIRQSRESNEKQNRAYVFIQKCLVYEIQEGYKVSIKFVNGGATPANNIQGNIWLSYSNDHNAEPTREHMPFPIRPIYLAPTDFKTIEIGVSGPDFPMEIRQGLLDGTISLMMFGEITYSDQFGNAQEMTFRFRRRVGPDSFFGQMIVAGRGLIST